MRHGRAQNGAGVRSRLLVITLAAIGPFSLNVFKPCLPWIKAEFEAPITTVQLGLSLSVVAAALATALAGWLADRLGHGSITTACVGLFAASSVLAAVAPSIDLLIAARVVQAASSSVALIVARAMAHDAGADAEKLIGRVTMLVVAGVLLAPALGGVLIEYVGWRAVFVALALGGVGLLLSRSGEPRSSASRASSGSTGERALGKLLGSPVFLGYALQSALHFALFFAFTSASAYLMVDVLGRPAYDYGMWFVALAAFTAVGLVSAERLTAAMRPGLVAFLGSACVLCGCIASAWTLLQHVIPLSPTLLFAPATLASFGVGLALPSTNAGVMSVAPRLACTASGLLGFLQFCAAAVFAQLVVQDEPNTPLVLARLMLAGGVASVGFGLLSIGAGRAPRAARGAVERR